MKKSTFSAVLWLTLGVSLTAHSANLDALNKRLWRDRVGMTTQELAQYKENNNERYYAGVDARALAQRWGEYLGERLTMEEGQKLQALHFDLIAHGEDLCIDVVDCDQFNPFLVDIHNRAELESLTDDQYFNLIRYRGGELGVRFEDDR